MGNYTLSHPHLLLLVLLFSCPEVQKRCARASETVNHEEHDSYVVEMKSLTPATTCKDQAKGRGLTLAHRQGPCSPIAANRQSRDSSIIFLRDQACFRSMNIQGPSHWPTAGNPGEDVRLPLHPGEGEFLEGEFLVTIGLGTPKVDLTLIFDTGSDITWTQCEPCPSCYLPSKSTTYSCPSCSPTNCTYSITYADGSNSSGYKVRDLLTLTPENKFPNFIFGCAEKTSNFHAADGILGLGQGDVTLISQTASNLSQIFCYCIPRSESSNGYLLFGSEALSTCQTDSYTPIIKDLKNPSFYFVKLVGMAFGKRKFDFSAQSQQSPPARTIIDSGTTITRLPPLIYSAVRAEFGKYMSKYPVAPKQSKLLNKCYDLRGQKNVSLPKIVLRFEKTNLGLDPFAVVWRKKNKQVCLAFAPNKNLSDPVIIGNVQQRNLNILYNIPDEKVEFGNGGCGN
ncbi:hypothetical protein BT93_G1626 [Corymbia citriodora subsp. variegata]|nr:hypothetical protein BT93_G1626 [Corymbia citriodora subsp. variegata]